MDLDAKFYKLKNEIENDKNVIKDTQHNSNFCLIKIFVSLNDDLIENSPILALEGAKIVVSNMGRLVEQMVDGTLEYFKMSRFWRYCLQFSGPWNLGKNRK